MFNFPLCKLYTNSLMSSLNSRHGWRFTSAKAGSTMLQSEGNLGIISTEDSMQTPLSPTSASGDKHYRASQNIPIMLREGVYRPNRTLSLSRPVSCRPLSFSHLILVLPCTCQAAAFGVDQKTHQEVFVHVESHRTVDENASTVGSGPNLLINHNIGMTPFGAKALSVCLSVDTDLSEKESQDGALQKGIECGFSKKSSESETQTSTLSFGDGNLPG